MATYDLKYPGAAIDAILDTAYDLQNAGYIFRGLASEYSNTPTERSWVLAGEGETGHGFTSPIPKGYIGVCVFNGTSWTGKLLKCVSIDSTPTNGSANALSSGGAYTSISQLATTVNEALDNLTFTDSTPSAFLGEYITEKVSTTDGGIERILTYFTILAATTSKAGLLSAADKAKLDAILTNLRSLEIDDTTAYADLGDKIVESIKATIGGTEETISTFQILAATASKAGLLSAADKAKLDALWSSGYQFAGIATPSTTPISTTSKIYYIATEGGTYFNAVTVTQGINILSWDGTSWSAVQVVGIDAAIKANSNNLLESGAAANLLDAASALATTPAPTVVDGKYMSDEGEVTNANMQYWKYSVSPNDSFLFSGKFSTNTNPYFVLWLNGSTVLGHESYMGSTETAVEYIDQMITAPANATHLCLNVESSQASLSKVKKLGDLLLSRELKDGILENKKYIDPVRGNMFIFDRAGVTPNGSIHEDWADGLACTDFLCITNEDNIVCENLWDNDYVVGVAFYNENKQFISRAVGTANPTGQTDFNISTEDIPEGAKYIRCTENYLRTGPHTIVSGVSLSSLNEKVLSLDSNLSDVQDAVTEYVLAELVPSVIPGGFYTNTGDFREFSSYQVNKYNVEGGGKYAFSGITVTGADLYYVTWWNEQDEFISAEPYKGSATEPTAFVNQIIQAPLYAHYLCLNVLTSRQDEFNASHATPSYVSSSELKDDIESLKNSNTGSMKVTVRGNTAYVRTSLDSTNDIIIKFSQYLNGNMSPVETYMGLNTATDDTIMQNTIHSWSDSTAPFRAVPQFWHLFAQHGIPVPLAVITDNPLTSSDVGAIWKDQSNREFTIGKVDGNNVYLIPKVTASGTAGIVTRDWKDFRDGYPTSLTHVSGGTYTSNITITSCSQYQVRPMQVPSGRKFLCDGKEVGNGTYMCSEFVISETLTCLDPTTMTAYFPTPTSSQNAFTIVNSFIFKGLSIGFNQMVSCENPFQFGYYGSNQAQHLVDTGGKTAYVMIPKTKKNNGNGDIMCKLFRSQTTDADVVIYRTESDLYNIDKLPDREISILKDNDTPVIGFASGVSLIRGITKDEVRNTFIAKSGTSTGNALYLSPANRNKFYVGVVIGSNTQKFSDSLMQPSFCYEFSTYYTYFKPTDDVQSYYYNDGDSTVIYIHSESNTGRIFVDVSKAGCEGGKLEVVEKTADTVLYSDSIVNGKVCVSFTSTEANYIVIKAN